MRWRVAGASVVGTSHVAQGTACQDDCWASCEVINGEPFVLLVAADGAGSAALGGEGAELIVRTAVAFFEERLSRDDARLDHALASDCAAVVRERLGEEAAARGAVVRDLAATFVAVLGSSTGTLAIQIGDGAAVVDVGDGLVVPTEPMNGDYANTTRFLTDADAPAHLAVVLFDRPLVRAAVFTDGIQRLALRLSTNTAHEPFLNPLFETLAATPTEREDELTPALDAYLASAAVNERTDDDKTLLLALAVG